MAEHIWYVAYGSNMSPQNLARYLPPGLKPKRTLALTVPHRLFFAGHSKTWGGAVAFLSLGPASGRAQAYARAFELPAASLLSIAQGENGAPELLPAALSAVAELSVGQWLALPVELDEHGFKGKYNALLRLPDISGQRAYTLTTARHLPAMHPVDAYLAEIRAALVKMMPRRVAHEYVNRALEVLPET